MCQSVSQCVSQRVTTLTCHIAGVFEPICTKFQGGGRVAGGIQGSGATGRWDGRFGRFGRDGWKCDFRNTCVAVADAGGTGVGASTP